MELEKVLHMNAGEGENSYAINSLFQRTVIAKVRPIVQNTIKELYCKTYPQCLAIADLGCSSGPNLLFFISDVIDTIDGLQKKLGVPSPEYQVFLNDLPGNDFNTIFKSVPYFCEQLRKDKGDDFPRCYIAGVPGSFYGRLFRKNSLLFVHSSYSLHWLSQVPRGIESNKGNIFMAKTSSGSVFEAYAKQFQRDFSLFLRSRSEEIISGGRMVITMVGRRSADPSSEECCHLWELLARSLRDMVALGLVEEAKLNSFNIPHYIPYEMEIRNIVNSEGSFHLDLLQTFDMNWNAADDPQNKEFVFDKVTSGQNVANGIRAVIESMLVNQFGEEIIEDLFQRFAEHVGEQLVKEKIKKVNLVISLTKIIEGEE